MKRILAAGISLAVLSLAVSTAQAQDSSFNPADVKGKITFFTHFSSYVTDGLFDRWEAEFKALYPGIEDVDVQAFQNYDDNMGTRLATGDYGDVLDIPGTGVTKADLPDFFQPIDDIAAAKDFYYTANWTADDKQYALTYGVGANGIVYNKAAFAKAGVDEVPTTWTEFLAAGEKLKAAGTIPLILNMGAGWPLDSFNGLGVAISGDADFNNKVVTDTSPFDADKPLGKSFAVLHTLVANGLVEPDLTTNNWEDSKGWLASGKGAMWFLGNWSINQVIQEGSAKAGVPVDAANIGFFPFPYDDNPTHNIVTGPDMAVAIAKNSKNPVAAKAWLEFLLTKSDISQIAGMIPGYKKMPPTLPQLQEISGYNPVVLEQTPTDAAYGKLTNLINYGGGKGAQEVMLAPDYAAAIAKLNADWADAGTRLDE